MGELDGVDLSNPDRNGYLMKKSDWLKDMRKRYFILKGSFLYFAKTPSHAPHGVIDLKEALTVKSNERGGRLFGFEVALKDRLYELFAETEKEKDEWIGAIGKAIVKSSMSYDMDGGYDSED